MAAVKLGTPAGDGLGLTGQTVAARFRIEQLVAEGGFGLVYRAQQVALQRPVALKVLKSADLGPTGLAEFHRRFAAEAQLVASLKHPHIVEVYDFGVSDTASGAALHWIALEWLEGQTLEGRLGARMDPGDVLVLLRPVLQAVGYAHRQGVAHRDLKPANIFLAQMDGRVVPKVLDFGIAGIMAADGGSAPDSAAQTTRAFSAFSPDYAAPEQVSYGRTGPWTDVHALGLILGELLTGERPYAGTDAEERLAAAVSERRPTPGSRGVGIGSWEPILAKALARRPQERYPDATDLLRALESSLPSVSAAGRAPGPRLRARVLVPVAAAGLALGGSYVGWRAWRRAPSSAQLRVAVLPFENLTGDPQQDYFSDGLTEGLIGALGRLAPERLAVIARTSVARYRGTRKNVREIAAELNVTYLLESSVERADDRVRVSARLVRATDEIQIWSQSYDRELRNILVLQSEVARTIAQSVRLELTPARSGLEVSARPIDPRAYDAYLRGRHIAQKRTPEALAQALVHMEAAIGIDSSFALAFAGKAEIFQVLEPNAYVRPADSKPQAIAAARRALALDDRLADAHMLLGAALISYEHDWRSGERHLRRALELDPNNADAHRWYGLIYLGNIGRHEEAVAELRRAVELAPVSLPVNVALGRVLYQARRHDEALTQLHRALDLDGTFWRAQLFVAKAYAEKGLEREATAALEGIAPVTTEVLAEQAYQKARFGHRSEAERLLDGLQAEARTKYVPAPFLAQIELGLGRIDQALESLERAYRDRSAWVISLRVDPVFDPLRSHRRFKDLLGRVGPVL